MAESEEQQERNRAAEDGLPGDATTVVRSAATSPKPVGPESSPGHMSGSCAFMSQVSHSCAPWRTFVPAVREQADAALAPGGTLVVVGVGPEPLTEKVDNPVRLILVP